jgi:hypothetical protein
MDRKVAILNAAFLGLALLGGLGLLLLSNRLGAYGPGIIPIIGLVLLGGLWLYYRSRGPAVP